MESVKFWWKDKMELLLASKSGDFAKKILRASRKTGK
jgi:hypothetical protein